MTTSYLSCIGLFLFRSHPFNFLGSRGVKSLAIVSSSNTSVVNGTSTFELYILRDDLSVNPIAENAASLRDQAIGEDGLCSFTIYDLDDVTNNILADTLASILGSDCNVTACDATLCIPCNSTLCSADVVADITEFRYCECDVAVGIDDADTLFMFTVAYRGNETHPVENDIKVCSYVVVCGFIQISLVLISFSSLQSSWVSLRNCL